jgi:hypothetical protein
VQPDRHPVGGTRRLPSPTVPTDDRGVRRSGGGWCETPAQAPNPDDPRSLRLATMVRQIARAGAGGRAGRWRRHGQGSRWPSRCRGPTIKYPEVSAAAGWPRLVDEAETTEVEMTHD